MSTYQKAVFAETGAPEDVLKVESASFEPLAEGEIRVRVNVAPINPSDINFVQGVYGIKPVLPSEAGLEGVGVVTESRSPDMNEGDEVIMLSGVGTWAEFVTGKAERFLKIRSDVKPEQAAMLKVNPLTAYRVLVGYTKLKPGDWVIQNAANSGVGRCLIQIAKAMGLHTINLVRRESLIAELAHLGGDVVLVDEEGVNEKVLELTGGKRPVLASNCVGGESATRLMSLLAPGGKMVTFGAMSKKSIKVPNSFLIFKRVELHGLWVTEWLKEASFEEILAAYEQLSQWMAEGKLHQAIDSVYTLDKVNEAVARAQEEHRDGKVLLDLRS